ADVGAAGDAVVRVDFYRESNGAPGLQPGPANGGTPDTLVGSDASPAGGWTASASVAGLPAGIYTYYAVATDTHGNTSPVGTLAPSARHTVAVPIVVSTLADELDTDYS